MWSWGKLTHLSEPCCVTGWGWNDTDSTTLSSDCSFHASVQASLTWGWRLRESVGIMGKPQMGDTKDLSPCLCHFFFCLGAVGKNIVLPWLRLPVVYEQILLLQPIGKALDRKTAGHKQGPNPLCNPWLGFHPVLSLGHPTLH